MNTSAVEVTTDSYQSGSNNAEWWSFNGKTLLWKDVTDKAQKHFSALFGNMKQHLSGPTLEDITVIK